METSRKFTVLGILALGAVAAGFNARLARAQALEGKFTLPSTTRWGTATLPPGDYSFTLNTVEPGAVVTVSSETRKVALIMSGGGSSVSLGRSKMVLKNGTVRELCLPQIGESFDYGISKPRGRGAPSERELVQVLPVTARAGGR